MADGSSLFFQCLLGMQCNDFTIIAADQTNQMSVLVLKHDENKIHDVSERQVMGIIGDTGDTGQFVQYIMKNIKLYKIKNGYELCTPAVVNFIRKNVIENVSNCTPAMVNILIGSYDADSGGELYTVDCIGSSLRIPIAIHGFGGLISMGLLDQYHRPDLTEMEAYELLKMCVQNIHERLLISLPNFQVKLVNKYGIKSLPTITPATFLLNNTE